MMLFAAGQMNFINSKVCLIGEWSITVNYYQILISVISLFQHSQLKDGSFSWSQESSKDVVLLPTKIS